MQLLRLQGTGTMAFVLLLSFASYFVVAKTNYEYGNSLRRRDSSQESDIDDQSRNSGIFSTEELDHDIIWRDVEYFKVASRSDEEDAKMEAEIFQNELDWFNLELERYQKKFPGTLPYRVDT